MGSNWKATIEYDGTEYLGWQRQPQGLTVQEVLESVLLRLTGESVAVNGSGRTDSGVHAEGQVANFRVEADRDRRTWMRGLNGLLPRDIRIVDLESVSDAFHARFDARSKRYLYRVLTSEVPSPFETRYRLHHREPLDVEAMRSAGARLLGRHDFRTFTRCPPPGRTTVRTLTALDIWRRGDTITFALEADGFLHTMVRSIVGTLLQIGTGKREPEDIEAILSSRDRTRTGPPAPAHGLFLAEVFYA